MQIVQVLEGTPAAEAGLVAGDVVLSVDGQKVENVEAMQNYLGTKIDTTVKIIFERGGTQFERDIKPIFLTETGRGGIGVGLLKSGIVSYPWYLAIWKGAESTVYFTGEIVVAFYDLIKNLIVTQRVSVDLSGPVGIAVLTGEVARMGFVYILQFTALLSVNLAVINVLPFPALDGGRILFLLIEKIRRKPVSQKIENIVHNVGFILLLLLIVLVTFHDVLKYSDKFSGLWEKIIK